MLRLPHMQLSTSCPKLLVYMKTNLDKASFISCTFQFSYKSDSNRYVGLCFKTTHSSWSSRQLSSQFQKRQWLSQAMESPVHLPPSPKQTNRLHRDMHWSPFFFPKHMKKGYLLWHSLKATTYTWQNLLLVSIFNYDNSHFWCAIQSAGRMLLIASTNDRGHTGWKMTPNAQAPGPLENFHYYPSM